VFTTSGTYQWSFVTQIFHNGHGGDCKTCGYYYEIMNLTHALKLFPSYKDTASAMKKWP